MGLEIEFEGFFKQYQNTVYRVIAGYVRERETAEDLTVEAFIKVFNRWKRISKMENPGGYLMRTGINLAKTHLRRDRKVKIVGISENDASNPQDSPETLFFQDAENRAVERELMNLKEKERNIVLMKDISGRTFNEIAATLKMKLPTVKSLYRRAKLKLAAKLGGDHGS